jgi:uncharacterized protein involved in cysteine biosynthesis
MSLVVDLLRAIGQLGDPRFMRVLLGAVALTIAALVLVFWAVMLGLGWVLPETMTLPWLGEVSFVDNLLSWAAIGLMIALSVILMVPAAALVVGFFLDSIAAAVEARHYPALSPVTELGLSEQVIDSVKFLGVVVAANLLALVIYFAVPPLAPFVFWLVNGYLLGREYFQLVAARRLGIGAAAELRRKHFWRIWLAGTAMVVPLSIPVLNLVVPVLGVAVFTHQFHRVVPAADLQ